MEQEYASGTQLAYTTLAHHTYADGHRPPTAVASAKELPDASLQERIMLSAVVETTSNGVQAMRTIIREFLKT